MEKLLKVAVAQTEIQENQYEVNIENALEFIKNASERNVDIICFPEFFTTGILPIPEDENGQTKKIMSSYAKKHSINIIAGTIVEKRENQFFNSTFIFSREGKIIQSYDKSHLYPLEKKFRQPGTTLPPIFEIDGIKISVVICIELIVPEIIRVLALKGVEVVFCPSFVEAWGGGNAAGEERRRICLTRATENQIFVIDACGVGTTTFYKKEFGIMKLTGYSTIAGPGLLSNLINAGQTEQELVIGELNINTIYQKREQVPILSSRRPELYNKIID